MGWISSSFGAHWRAGVAVCGNVFCAIYTIIYVYRSVMSVGGEKTQSSTVHSSTSEDIGLVFW